MFMIVKFGDNESLLCNLMCRTRILYEYIKTNCGCDAEDVIDLAEENGGQLKNLPEKLPNQYAYDYLTQRTTFILVKVTRKVEENTGKIIKLFQPLLKGLPESHPDFMAKLYNRRINPDASSQDQRYPSAKPEKRTRITNPRASTLQSSPSRQPSKMRSPTLGKKMNSR